MLPDALQVIDAWGMTYKTSFVWDKIHHNYGHYNSVRHELLLLATRGSCLPDSKTLHDSVVSVERSDTHSAKPDEFYAIIESMYTAGPYLEMFARRRRKSWETWGNEVKSGRLRRLDALGITNPRARWRTRAAGRLSQPGTGGCDG